MQAKDYIIINNQYMIIKGFAGKGDLLREECSAVTDSKNTDNIM